MAAAATSARTFLIFLRWKIQFYHFSDVAKLLSSLEGAVATTTEARGSFNGAVVLRCSTAMLLRWLTKLLLASQANVLDFKLALKVLFI